jgi:transposase
MCGLLVSYCCGADVTLEVQSCHEFCVINLDSPFFICTKEEQRAVVHLLWAEGVPGAEMHRKISAQYGNSVMSQQMVYEWIKRFKNGHTSNKHQEGARRVWLFGANEKWTVQVYDTKFMT